jgi:hypothetical protein
VAKKLSFAMHQPISSLVSLPAAEANSRPCLLFRLKMTREKKVRVEDAPPDDQAGQEEQKVKPLALARWHADGPVSPRQAAALTTSIQTYIHIDIYQ